MQFHGQHFHSGLCEPTTSYPLQKAHLLKLRAGVGQALQSVGQVVVCCKVEAICMKNIVDHGQESLIVLHLKQETDH